MDLHAQQIQGFFDIPVDHLYASPILFQYLKTLETDNLTLFSPDVGGMKMASAYASMLKVPLVLLQNGVRIRKLWRQFLWWVRRRGVISC